MPTYYYTTVACPCCGAAAIARTFDCKIYGMICVNSRCPKHHVQINAMFVECEICCTPCVAYELEKPATKHLAPRYQYMCRDKCCALRGRTQVLEINKYGHLVKPERV